MDTRTKIKAIKAVRDAEIRVLTHADGTNTVDLKTAKTIVELVNDIVDGSRGESAAEPSKTELPDLEASIRKVSDCAEGQEWRVWDLFNQAERERAVADWNAATCRANVRLAIREVAMQLRWFAERVDDYATNTATKEADLALRVLGIGLQIPSSIKLDVLIHRATEIGRLESELAEMQRRY